MNRMGVAEFLQAAHDERLEELQCQVLGQPTLVKLEFGTDLNYRATGIIDSLAQEVLAEETGFALEPIGQGSKVMLLSFCATRLDHPRFQDLPCHILHAVSCFLDCYVRFLEPPKDILDQLVFNFVECACRFSQGQQRLS